MELDAIKNYMDSLKCTIDKEDTDYDSVDKEIRRIFYYLITYTLSKDGFECDEEDLTAVEFERFFNGTRPYVFDNLKNELMAYFCMRTDRTYASVSYGIVLMKRLYANIVKHFNDGDNSSNILGFMTLEELTTGMNLYETNIAKCSTSDILYKDILKNYYNLANSIRVSDNKEEGYVGRAELVVPNTGTYYVTVRISTITKVTVSVHRVG